jgi:hypothetical protein
MLPAGIEITLQEVDDDMAGAVAGKMIPMESDPFGCRQFDPDVMIFQPDGVVGGAGDLMAVIVMGGVPFGGIAWRRARCGPGR